MAKTILTAVLVVLLNVLVGCESIDSGRSQRLAPRAGISRSSAPVVEVAAGEADIVEQVEINRQAYRRGLEVLVRYYTNAGNHMKLTWAEKELRALNSMAQYDYIVEVTVAGPELKARASVPDADFLFWQASELEKKAGVLPIIKNEDVLRLALDKYNQVMRRHPSSDKIDDAAYKAGGICEYFGDYSIALLYYQRTYQWDPETIYPARFRVGFIYDKHLHDRAKALEAYQQAVKSIRSEYEHMHWMKFAEKRIRELTKSEEGSQ